MRVRQVLGASAVSALVVILVAAGTQPVSPSGAAPIPSVRFTASGDFSASSAARAVFDRIGAIDPDLHVALGDLSYGEAGGEEEWCDLVTDRVGEDLPFQLLAGNHESDGRNGFIDDFAACLPNRLPGLVGTYARQYYVDIPAEDPLVRYVAVSPGITFPDGVWRYDEGGPRYEWTEEAIDGARAADIPWVVVGMHNPCLSVGRYGCGAGEDLVDLFLDTGVDLVLGGHEHIYQRSHQLTTSADCPAIRADAFDPDCVADDDASMTPNRGTVFATVGTGGTSLRDVYPDDVEAPYFAAWSGANENPTFGSLDVTVTPMGLAARFDRASGGTFSDEFTIGTTGVPRPSAPEPAPARPLAADAFDRDVDAGWGTADRGGSWRTTSASSRYFVADGAARVVVRPGRGPNAYLSDVTSDATVLRATIGTDEPVTGRGVYVSLTPRYVAGSGAYTAKVTMLANGDVRVQPVRVHADGTLDAALAAATVVPGLDVEAGEPIRLAVDASGTSPTTVRTKAWSARDPEPDAWLQTTTDSAAALQGAGSIAVNVYLSSSAEGPVEVFLDDLSAVTE